MKKMNQPINLALHWWPSSTWFSTKTKNIKVKAQFAIPLLNHSKQLSFQTILRKWGTILTINLKRSLESLMIIEFLIFFISITHGLKEEAISTRLWKLQEKEFSYQQIEITIKARRLGTRLDLTKMMKWWQDGGSWKVRIPLSIFRYFHKIMVKNF